MTYLTAADYWGFFPEGANTWKISTKHLEPQGAIFDCCILERKYNNFSASRDENSFSSLCKVALFVAARKFEAKTVNWKAQHN